MTTIRLSDGIVKDDVLVVGLASKSSKGTLQIESGDLALDTKSLLQTLSDLGATGKADEVIKIPGSSTRLLVFTGLGKSSTKYENEALRRASGAAARALAGNSSATFSLPAKDKHSIRAIAEGAALGNYAFSAFKGSTKSDQKTPLKAITIHTALASIAEVKQEAKSAEVIAQYTGLVRDLINTPPSHLTPESFCSAISEAVKKAGGASIGLKVSVMNESQLKSKGFGGITAVGQGSVNPPRLLNISYTPKGAKAAKKYAFVGKGITFDTGGLALKPALGMEAMKSDMSGAAAVCAATIAIALLNLPVEIDTWAPLAENMVSDTATRPSDVITMYGGKTVEVLNPDAEGRLVLGDALVKAQEEKGLTGIIDVATLTGAQVVALGTRTSAVMTNNEKFSAQFLKLAEHTGEAFWPMPLPIELRASLDSPIADMANIGERMGGMLVAGLFLKEFIAEDLPWLHLDIAGPAYNEGQPHGYTPVGGTGIALRTLVALAELSE
ncbi:MAG: leucyl aminopeptidase [Actinobacteria bacterium]|uniref:leucyl aminopeptidase n=1 Tax=freshwater metagenome TaxID=449393 RepID=A0A6J5YZW9_9ZZZZ|nr:leucyl aminopeptidase [Actinomycetota bacterium]